MSDLVDLPEEKLKVSDHLKGEPLYLYHKGGR